MKKFKRQICLVVAGGSYCFHLLKQIVIRPVKAVVSYIKDIHSVAKCEAIGTNVHWQIKLRCLKGVHDE